MNDTDTDIVTSGPSNIIKRGRKKGSNDSVFISMETLLKYLNPKNVIPVRRLWLESLGELHGVSFVEEPSPVKVELVERVISEEVFGDPRDAVVRPRIDIEETEL